MFGRLAVGILYFIFAWPVCAQTFEEGLALEQDFQDEKALAVYELVIQSNPGHASAWAHASRMLSNLGGRLDESNKAVKAAHIAKSKIYAERAIDLNNNLIESHLALVIALGLQSEISGSATEKIKNARLIYAEGSKILALDSSLAIAHFIMGKWHLELARLNWMERTACDLFFGGMPEGVSMNKALAYLQKASLLEPGVILFLYNEALVHHHLNNDQRAIELIRQALHLSNREPDDDIRKAKCKALLRQLE